MARRANIIKVAPDAWGDHWDVRQVVATTLGVDCLQGWPHGMLRGKGGTGGPRWIITEPLKSLLEARARGGTLLAGQLPFGAWAIKRMRRVLGIDRQSAASQWWEDRFSDLEVLTVEAFAEKHDVCRQSVDNWRHRLGLAAERKDYWWLDPEHAARIASKDLPLSWIADYYGLSMSRIWNIRYMLRKHGLDVLDRRGGTPVATAETRLYFGPYYAPDAPVGSFLVCAVRGKAMTVAGYTSAPVPWPYATLDGDRVLVVCSRLIAAIRQESIAAVAHHWGVTVETVGEWRARLKTAERTTVPPEAWIKPKKKRTRKRNA